MESKPKKGGLKIQELPIENTQRTLQDAFRAGEVLKEAKDLKRKALQAKEQIEVNLINLKLRNVLVFFTVIQGFLGYGKFYGKKPVLIGGHCFLV